MSLCFSLCCVYVCMQANEEPFEPVWFDETMNQWVVPGAKK